MAPAAPQPTAGAQPAQAAPRAAIKPEKTELNVGVAIPSSNFTHLYVTEKRGFWKDEGLDVKMSTFQSGSDASKALVAGSLDISVNNLTQVMDGIKAKQDLKVFWAGINTAEFEWYSPRYKTVGDARGARFGITRTGSLTDVLTRFALRKAGLDPDKDARIVQGGDSNARIAAMEAGQIDVTILSPPHKYIARERGWNLMLSQKQDIAPDWPSDVHFARQDFIDKYPQTIKAYLRGAARGVRFLKQDPEATAAILSEYTTNELKHTRLSVPEVAEALFEDGRLPSRGLDVFMDVSVLLGDIDQPWPRERYWDARFFNTYQEWKP